MKNQFIKVIGGAALAILILMIFVQVWVSAQGNAQNDKGLIGSWNVQVTIRDCQTGTAFVSFPAMMTYHEGGTMTEAANDATPLLRTGGQGVWSYRSGRQYSSAFQFFRYNSDGTYAGTTKVRKQIEVSKSGDTYSATATFDFLDANGNPNGSGCATEAGTRFE